MSRFWCFLLVFISLSSTTIVAQEKKAEKAAQQFAALREKVVIETDVEYAKAGDVSLKLDVYKPIATSLQTRPCIVWIHGGGWQNGDKSSGAARVGRFVASGDYVGVSVGYRFTDVASWPAQIYDCKAAIRYIRANAAKLGIDPNKIGVWGASAGGHLVSVLGTSGDVEELEGELGTTNVSSRVNCVVDFCGPADFPRLGPNAPKVNEPGQSVYKLFNGPMKDRMDIARQASPVTYVSKDDPPFLIVQGTADPLVPLDQSVWFHAAQKNVGMNTTLIKIEGGGHSISGSEIDARVASFFERELLGKNVAVSAETIHQGEAK